MKDITRTKGTKQETMGYRPVDMVPDLGESTVSHCVHGPTGGIHPGLQEKASRSTGPKRHLGISRAEPKVMMCRYYDDSTHKHKI